MPSNYTEHFKLSQWERSDKVLMDDFNADNAKIDGALGELATASAKHGNCHIERFVYRGTGESGEAAPTRIQFPRMPTFFFMFGAHSALAGTPAKGLMFRYTEKFTEMMGSDTRLTWNGNEVSFYGTRAEFQLNVKGVEYQVVSFYTEG